MSGQADTWNRAEQITSVAEACNVLRARAAILGRQVHRRVVDRPRAVDVAGGVAKDDNGRHFGLERTTEA
jgi:hypothetical protein